MNPEEDDGSMATWVFIVCMIALLIALVLVTGCQSWGSREVIHNIADEVVSRLPDSPERETFTTWDYVGGGVGLLVTGALVALDNRRDRRRFHIGSER